MGGQKESVKKERLKAIHAVIDGCGNLYCKKDAPNCNKCPLSVLIPSRPDIRGVVGNCKLIGGSTSHNSNHEMVFDFITKKGTFSYNEATHELKSKFQIC